MSSRFVGSLRSPGRLGRAISIGTRALMVGALGLVAVTGAAQAPGGPAAFAGTLGRTVKDSVPAWPQAPQARAGAPNIVLILLDDAGYANSSTFGGPAHTPTLDRLAGEGLRYNRFHVAAICSATRAALLSGRNDHRIGFGVTPAMGSGYPGYNGIWPKSAASIAEILRRNGYRTSAFGKWHNTPEYEISPFGPFDRWPTGLGFGYFYGIMNGLDSQWEPALYENTTPINAPKSREEGYHFTTDIADQAIRWVQTHEALAPEQHPYFLYFALGATHFPHHVPADWIERYHGQFDQGWDKMREEIFARQKRLGVIPPDAALTPRPAELPAWDSLTPAQQKLLAREMEVEAAFMSHADHEIGRLVEAVRNGPGGENTIILYVTGDNGGDLEGGVEGRGMPGSLDVRVQHLADLGSERIFNSFSAGWGWATNTPFQWGKIVASHLGGITNPLVVSWPAGIKDAGGLRSQFTHANDVAATLYELAGIAPPASVDGVEQLPLDGTSFAYSFDQPAAPSRHRVQIFEQLGNRAIYEDGWMASARHAVPGIGSGKRNGDFDQDEWELYHLDEDFSQAHNVAAEYPDKLQALQARFDAEAWENNIYPLCPPAEQTATWLTKGRKLFRYPGDLPRMPGWAAPRFNASHRIVADLVVPAGGAEGVIVSDGSRFGGFVLYVQDNHLVYESNGAPFNFEVEHDLIRSDRALPEGRVEVTYEFVRDVDPAKIVPGKISGQGRLYINQQLVGEARLANVTPNGTVEFLGTFNIGQGRASPVSTRFKLPFKFTGLLKGITVQLK